MKRTLLRRVAGFLSRLALSTYQAAEKNRTNSDWDVKARTRSADASIIGDRKLLDARSRQMVRDDPIAASIVHSFVRNVVGTGIEATASATGEDGKALSDFNKKIDDLWYDWSKNPTLVDMERRKNLAAFQRWIISELITTGEAIFLKSYESRQNHVGLVLQAIESDQLDMYRIVGNDNNEVRGGVEVDKYGAAVAYWIYPRHPNDYVGMRRETPMSLQSERIPADRVCHVFEAERARQTRGVSRMAPVLQKMRDLGQYDYAQLIAARAEACIGLLVTTPPTGATGRIGMGVEGADPAQDSDGNDQLSMQPLMVARLSAGQDIKAFTPTRPGNVYQPFVEKQLSLIGAGVGLSPEQVSRDFTKGTYSSQRQAMLEDRREFEPLQEMLIAQAMRPIRDEFIRLAVLQGLIQAPGYGRNPDLYTTTEWRGQGWEWIDPRSEADAYETMLRLGLDTKRRILLAKGQDWREVATQRADETKLEASLGLSQPETPNGSGATATPPASNVQHDTTETESADQQNANSRELEPQEMP